MKFTEDDVNNIEKAVEDAEKKTSGEIVPVVMDSSDAYNAAHLRCGMLVGFFAAIVFYFLTDKGGDPIWILWVQIPGIILGYFLANISFVKYLLITKAEVEEEVNQRAMEVFLSNNLHMTRDRTGVLIFISELERKVVMLADEGINDKVASNTWDDLVEKLVSDIKQKRAGEGIAQAVESCGDILATHFPPKDDDTNEIDNKFIRE